jgi:uncharacterized protein (TIGR03083 family)
MHTERGTRLDFPAYLQHIERQSARFTDALEGARGDERVPTCPDWSADDLLYHLSTVQTHWSRVVGENAQTDAEVEAFADPGRPASHEGLVAMSRTATDQLLRALRSTDPTEPRWTWSDEQTAGFIYRRQAHEAMIHRLDAELTVGQRTPLDPALASDGIDEALKIMYAGCPPWGSVTPHEGRSVLVRATDADVDWLVTLARFTGTDPKDGKTYDDPDITVSDAFPGAATAATITGSAEDLDCWLWHRPPPGDITRSGDPDLLRDVEAVLAQPLN